MLNLAEEMELCRKHYFEAEMTWAAIQLSSVILPTRQAGPRECERVAQVAQLVPRSGVGTQGSLQPVLDFFKIASYTFYVGFYIYRFINILES